MKCLTAVLLSLHLLPFHTLAQTPKTNCQVTVLNGLVTHKFTYAEGDLSASVEQAINTLDKLANGDAAFKIFAGGEEYLTQKVKLANGIATKSLNWGKKIQGLNAAEFTINNGIVIGSLDQRKLSADLKGLDLDIIKLPADLGKRQVQNIKPINLKPLQPIKINPTIPLITPPGTSLNFEKIKHLNGLKNILKFNDANPVPVVSTDAALSSKTAEFTNRFLAAFKTCTTNFQPTNSNIQPAPPPAPLDRRQDLGHFSSTYSAGSCDRCKVLAVGAVILAEIGCVAATCWWSFGLGCVVCTATAATASVAAVQGCEWSGACCPVTCGAGSFPLNPPRCCFGNEACLNGNGSCCSRGQVACAGKACCNSGQSCLSIGPQKGLCCPDKAVCGVGCCGDNQECVGGKSCCSKADSCGDKCCNPISPEPGFPNFAPLYCADRSKSLCCPQGEVQIGQSGICCKAGSRLVDGRCSLPGAVQCGGQDCIGVCKNGVCEWNPTDQDCLFQGFRVGACKNHLGKEYGCSRCSVNGCCLQPVPK